MNKIVKNICKKALIILMSVITFGSAIISSFTYAYGGSAYNQLGTRQALGSPVLNNNFTTEQWNKWETICWGVFLSNFCVPLIDNYKSAFSSGNGGSNGSGYKALCFGSGNDTTNNEVIQNFCNYAVTQQESSGTEIYVTYNYLKDKDIVENGDIISSGDDSNTSAIRKAKFQDLFMVEGSPASEDTLKSDVENVESVYKKNTADTYFTNSNTDESYTIDTYEGTFPTFWIKTNSGKYEKIFDYKDPWDIQISTLMTSKAMSSDRKSDFVSAFDSYYSANSNIRFDCFGNIVTSDGKVIIPAAANRNITTSGDINLVNSFILNGTAESASNDRLIEGVAQYIDEGLFGSDKGGIKGASPALSGQYNVTKDASAYIYYDFDNVAVDLGSSKPIGHVYSTLFDSADATAKNQKYNLKVEASNILKNNFLGNISDKDSCAGIVASNQIAASLVSTYINEKTQPGILSDITMSDGSKVSLFSDKPIVINPQLLTDPKNSDGKAIHTRQLYNFFYQCYKGNIKETTVGSLSTSAIKNALENDVVISQDLKEFLEESNIWKTYVRVKGLDSKTKYKDGVSIAGVKIELEDYCGNETFDGRTPRTIVLYPTSNVMRSVSNILGVVEGTEFQLYSTYIYVTYLDFYGVTHKSDLLGSNSQTSKFKENLFEISADVMNLDPAEVLDAKSEAELEKEVLNYSYLMLSPTAGRAYRTELITNGLSDWIYDNYKRIVFGTATTDGSSISTKSNSGFLHIDTYLDNPLTAAFLKSYSDIALTLIMIMFIIMILWGLIRGRKVSWYLFTAIAIVNTILLIPSTGELVPYFTSTMVQSMFSNKMTYWAVSEAISNASLEADAVSKGLEGLTEDESKQVTKLVKTLNVVYLDRALMVKRDISAKVTQKVEGTYSDIQNIASARWLLPTIMRQYSSEESRDDYVYIPLGDLFDDMSNIYWHFNPNDAVITHDLKPTMTSGQSVDNSIEDLNNHYTNAIGKFTDYVDFSDYDGSNDDSVAKRDIEYQSVAYVNASNNPEKLIHNYSYILTDLTIPNRQGLTEYGKVEFKDITEVMEKGIAEDRAKTASTSTYEDMLETFESIANQYDRSDRNTVHTEYSYLLATESPAHYFYQLVKDSFKDVSNPSLGNLIGSLQGQYNYDKDDKLVRDSFMHATEIVDGDKNEPRATGYTRDVLDLQSLFGNMVPYLYQLQITTGGMDGEGGVLTDSNGNPILIEKLPLYEGQNASWLFRSNWAVKIIECPEYNKPMIVKDADNNKYTVSNPILPECYPNERPMVFSEAQKEAYGLHDSDLNIVELKCIEANKKIVNKWTMLINYAGTSNLTLEVLERQMALDATLVFDEEFSPSGMFNASYAMYPQTIDLRNISFDSVMKMIMLNVSKDTSYIYGDTMAALIDTTDIITALLLLIVAFLCAYIIPGARTILMAAIFYLGFLAIIRAIFASNKYKAKVTCGQLISNVLFLFITFCFYFVFYLLINITSADEVLITSQASITPGNPVWSLALILIACIMYITAMVIMLNFCFKNYRDMGMEIYGMIAHSATERVKSGIRGIRADLGKRENAEAMAAKQNEKTGTKEGNVKNNSDNVIVNVTTESSYDKRRDKFVNKNQIKAEFKREEAVNYNEKANNTRSQDAETANSIDDAIKKGAEKSETNKTNNKK